MLPQETRSNNGLTDAYITIINVFLVSTLKAESLDNKIYNTILYLQQHVINNNDWKND